MLVDAYVTQGDDNSARKAVNNRLLLTTLTSITGGEQAIDALRATATTAASRHTQMWFADRALQALVVDAGYGGAVAPRGGDVIGVFTQNLSGHKNDVFRAPAPSPRTWCCTPTARPT